MSTTCKISLVDHDLDTTSEYHLEDQFESRYHLKQTRYLFLLLSCACTLIIVKSFLYDLNYVDLPKIPSPV
jgi:hypothetical protein